jgi:hypothetical protein
MKSIKLLMVLLALTCIGAANQPVSIASAKKAPPDPKKVEQKQEYSPQVKLFVARCLEDEEHKFSNAEAWLKLQKVAQPDKDQMTEILSGLVWNTDRERARKIALEIKNLDKQKAVLSHYDALDLLPPPPAKKK